MKTIKRTIPELNTSLTNTNKFFNHFDFKGIKEPHNIFNADQNSFEDVKNVYVDDDQFVSRNPLQKDIEVPKDAIPYLYDLIDYLVIGDSKLYISKNKINNNIIVNLFNDGQFYTISDITQYHISSIEHYIICFNDKGAQIFDVSANEKEWKDLSTSDLVNIPIIKRVVGGEITTYPENEFTKSYKEEYIWSNESQPILPADGDYEVKVIAKNRQYNWKVSDINKATNFKLLRSVNINIQDTDLITIAKDIICIARKDYFLVSFNGVSFTTVYYPLYNGEFLDIASISEDGKNFFFVAEDGVYRCNLGTLQWGDKISVSSINGETTIKYKGKNNICKFLTADIFAFLTYESGSDSTDPGYNANSRLYWKGPGLYMGTNYLKDSMGNWEDGKPYVGYSDLTVSGNIWNYPNDLTYKDTDKYRINIFLSQEANGTDITTITFLSNDEQITTTALEPSNEKIYQSKLTLIRGGDTSFLGLGSEMFFSTLARFTMSVDSPNSGVQEVDIPAGSIISGLSSEIVENAFICKFDALLLPNPDNAVNAEPWVWRKCTIEWKQVPSDGNPDTPETIVTVTEKLQLLDLLNGAPFALTSGYIADYEIWDNFSGELVREYLPEELDGKPFLRLYDPYELYRKQTFASGDHFYIVTEDNELFTNNLESDSIATITYKYSSNDPFTKIPNVSYSDTELYLAFGDTLQITENNRDGTKILFNLPPKNNQAFINNITAMINISTTEVALFFENKIVICSKVEDQNLGYRYDYYNTKLSLGVRLNDSVINTLEGSYTIFPTKRGLAVMNYQAFMATTDQIIEYITDDIKSLWTRFYEVSSVIKIIQWRNHLVFTNNSKDILIYNLKTQTWWRWEVPFNTLIAITDQIDLRLICRGELTIFTDKYLVNNEDKQLNYYDFSANGENIVIDWFVQSQPLHMNAPNYYKNLRQLIFQLFTDNEEFIEPTMLAQIKLYRKKITLREPEVVKFTIEKLRTFVKRFNYWKINEIQWGLANDTDTNNPAKFRLNGISIKYEIGEEVR